MSEGDTFVCEDAQGTRYEAQVVWSGRGYLCAHLPWPMRSSMCEGGSQQPAKGVSGRGRPAPCGVSQAALRP
jgi:hypothetical protein